jgi:hypothetical protein
VQPVVNPGAVGLVGDGRVVAQPGQPFLGIGDRVEDLAKRPLTAADRAQVRAMRFRDGQRDAPGGQQFDLIREHQRLYPGTAQGHYTLRA